ncbi:Radical SAM superfamily protein [Streptomyces sp. DvalAA-14]|uniref:radical SAM protein n=1 Tax=unclassified Streptomyces TaxID=2593676 RepID=UPI00081B57E9|nr:MULTISPECIES: radical SAM protein [unclassified Streptomyces]MYS23804.1 radical SAM protein [Streptomyces sp. SID4948]SCE38854.1 Radical SAM superfamily protein [Streptomyces sp. DvalAA-14]
MRIAVCGGPYGNPYALQSFVDDARARGAERLFCLGDLGGFGAEVNALWPILTDNGIECVAGNYDVAVARRDTDCGCGYRDPKDNEYAQLVYDHTLATTSRDFAAHMGTLPTELRETIDGVDVHMVHGSTLALNDFWWESLPEEEHRLRVDASGADVVLCTHTGLPWQRRIGDTLAVNVGVLGKPANDGRREVWYAILDVSDGHVAAELVPLAYDWQAQARSMRGAGLPEIFAETIETGWWTTCLEVLPPLERSRGRYQLYRSVLPSRFRPTDDGWGDSAPQAMEGDRPVVPLFGTPYFPSRLWIYTNFHCNLACRYCAVASFPKALARTLPADTFRALVDEAVQAGFSELYVTGGEPFLHPHITGLLDYASAELPTVVMTNAILLRGRRAAPLGALAGRKLTVQTSLDGASAATHDAQRGEGSWRRTMDGIRHLIDLGLPPRVALTETTGNAHEIPAVAELLAGLGLPADHFAARPLLRRGFSETGAEIGADSSVPELTATADGLHWHPAGADLATSPDLHLAPAGTPLTTGQQLVTERFFAARLIDGTLPRPVHCAV